MQGTDTEGRAEEVEEMKQAQLKKQKEGKGQWEDGLASDSESIVGSFFFPPGDSSLQEWIWLWGLMIKC